MSPGSPDSRTSPIKAISWRVPGEMGRTQLKILIPQSRVAQVIRVDAAEHPDHLKGILLPSADSPQFTVADSGPALKERMQTRSMTNPCCILTEPRMLSF